MRDDFLFLTQSAALVAPRLLGSLLIREIDGQRLIGRIVETEAYDQTDAASHSYKGRTPRTEVMFGPAGHLYVYFTYGLHYCCNIVTGAEGAGSAVLIRAVEPVKGVELMRERRRGIIVDGQLTNGPAKLCQAFAIDASFNGHDLSQSPLMLEMQPVVPKSQILTTPRIGITHAKDVPWRFVIANSVYTSKYQANR